MGFLQTAQSGQYYIFHLITKRFTLDPDKFTRDPCNQQVFIGCQFDCDHLIGIQLTASHKSPAPLYRYGRCLPAFYDQAIPAIAMSR